jgi:molybdenum cofactor cytidylyltransferase
MNLELLDVFQKKDQIAWVGSGGKTSLIFSIAKAIYNSSIITTTTHLALEQLRLANRHFRCDNPTEWITENKNIDGVTLITKEPDDLETNRLQGYLPSELTGLSVYCLQNDIPLFIEADGSRQRPLKAPASHEPQIPEFVNKVCIVLGLGGLGKTISDEWVHRPQIFSKIINKKSNLVIEIDDIFEYLIHPNGGLKSISTGVEKILFLNQIDLVENKESIMVLAEKCRPYFDHILISSVDQKTNELEIYAHFGKIACILLAAGESKRFGSPKQLAHWNESTFIRTIIEKVKTINPSEFLVIVGAFSELIMTEIDDFPTIKIIHNPDWKTGQASSVRIGVENLSNDVEAVIFFLVDQPQIDVITIRKLVISYATTNAKIIAYSYNGMARHPILFSKQLFPELKKLSGISGGKQLFDANPPLFLTFKDPNQALDFDSREDLKNYMES